MDDAFPLDFARLRPRRRSNAFLLLPPGFAAATRPDASSPVFPVGRPALLQAVKRLATEEPRTELVRGDGRAGQALIVARSRIFRFPDRITVQAVAQAAGAGGSERSALAIYSRAVHGRYDFGVNRRRIERWLGILSDLLGRA